jgi:lambda family phage tail tape measure protein
MAQSEYTFKLKATGGNEVKSTFNDVAKSGDAAFKGIEQSSSNAFKYAKMALGGIAAYATIDYFQGMVKGAIDAQDELGKMAQKVGMSVEDLSKLEYAAKLADVSTEELRTGLKKLNTGMVDAASGTGKAYDALKVMGISVKDSSGTLKTNGQILNEVADQFEKYGDGAQKSALAVAIFGKAGDQMIPMLNGGSKSIKELGLELDKYGAVVTTGAAKASEEFNDNLTRLSAQSSTLGKSVANALLPTMNSFVESLIAGKVYLKEHGAEVIGVSVALGTLGAAYVAYAQRAAIAKTTSMIFDGVAGAIELARGGTAAWSIALVGLNNTLKLTKIALVGTGIGAFAVGAGLLAESVVKANEQINAQGEDRIKLIEKEKDSIVQGIANYEKNGKSATKLDQIRANGLERLISLEAEIQEIRNKKPAQQAVENKPNAPTLVDSAKAEKEAEKYAKGLGRAQDANDKFIASMREMAQKDQLNIDSAFMSETEKKFVQDMITVNKSFLDTQAEITKQYTEGRLSIKDYNEQASILSGNYQFAADQAQNLKQKQDALNQSWSYGASRALNSYFNEASNMARNVEGSFTRMAKGMEDSIVNFAMTGQQSFTQLANSMIADMVRIMVQQSITAPLAKAGASFFAGMFGGSSGVDNITTDQWTSGNFAKGGGFDSGVQKFAKGGAFTNTIVDNPTLFKFAKGTGLMGEAGPEAIMPLSRDSSGRLGVTTNGGGAPIINMNVVNQGSADGYQASASARKNDRGFDIEVMIQKVVNSDISRNGPMSQNFAGAFGLRRGAR